MSALMLGCDSVFAYYRYLERLWHLHGHGAIYAVATIPTSVLLSLRQILVIDLEAESSKRG